MSLTTALATYFIIWWVVLFTTLPFGVKRHSSPQKGLEPGAPEKPMLGKKVLATTLIATLVFALVYVLASSDLISFRDMAEQMEPTP